jgi:hypothetical protein
LIILISCAAKVYEAASSENLLACIHVKMLAAAAIKISVGHGVISAKAIFVAANMTCDTIHYNQYYEEKFDLS